MKCQILFLRKKSEYFKMSSAKIFIQHAKCYIFISILVLQQTNKSRKVTLSIFSLFLHENIYCGYLLEVPQ